MQNRKFENDFSQNAVYDKILMLANDVNQFNRQLLIIPLNDTGILHLSRKQIYLDIIAISAHNSFYYIGQHFHSTKYVLSVISRKP